jgi:hypothetical protein
MQRKECLAKTSARELWIHRQRRRSAQNVQEKSQRCVNFSADDDASLSPAHRKERLRSKLRAHRTDSNEALPYAQGHAV